MYHVRVENSWGKFDTVTMWDHPILYEHQILALGLAKTLARQFQRPTRVMIDERIRVQVEANGVVRWNLGK